MLQASECFTATCRERLATCPKSHLVGIYAAHTTQAGTHSSESKPPFHSRPCLKPLSLASNHSICLLQYGCCKGICSHLRHRPAILPTSELRQPASRQSSLCKQISAADRMLLDQLPLLAGSADVGCGLRSCLSLHPADRHDLSR